MGEKEIINGHGNVMGEKEESIFLVVSDAQLLGFIPIICLFLTLMKGNFGNFCGLEFLTVSKMLLSFLLTIFLYKKISLILSNLLSEIYVLSEFSSDII